MCFASEIFYFGGNINFNEKYFFAGIFTHLSSKLCIPVILKINSCLLSRLFHTGRVQTKAKTTKRNMRLKGQTARVYFRIS